ncbi:STAS-like domain-containing protein [Vibrio owensii]|uniref:STAS-like domain-containing protein n=1 Tax=Vibrio harveyi group TaxID=717610 RepID=UPI003CC68B35
MLISIRRMKRQRLMIVKIADLIGRYAVSYRQGDALYDVLHTQLIVNGKPIILDFASVNLTATPFHNASIGRLLGLMSIERCIEMIDFQNMSLNDKYLLNVSISNALNHYASKTNKSG